MSLRQTPRGVNKKREENRCALEPSGAKGYRDKPHFLQTYLKAMKPHSKLREDDSASSLKQWCCSGEQRIGRVLLELRFNFSFFGEYPFIINSYTGEWKGVADVKGKPLACQRGPALGSQGTSTLQRGQRDGEGPKLQMARLRQGIFKSRSVTRPALWWLPLKCWSTPATHRVRAH